MTTATTELDLEAMGERIRRLRLERGLSQEALAAPRYTAAYISHLEKGKRSASSEAIEHIAARLDVEVDQLVTGRDPKRRLQLQLEVDSALAQLYSGNLEEPRQAFERVRRAARRDGFIRVHAAAEEGLGRIEKKERRWKEAIARFNAAEELLADEPVEARTSALAERAGCLFMLNDMNRSIHLLETHRLELEQSGSPDPAALMQVYSYLIPSYFEAGLRDKAAEIAEQAHRLETKVQDPEHIACMNINRAQILIEQGRLDEAMQALTRAEELFRSIGWRASAAKASVARATAAVEAGELDEAEHRAEDALAELAETPSLLDQVRAINLLARIARLRGQIDTALRHLDQVDKLLKGQSSMEVAWALRERALCETVRGEMNAAAKLLQRSLKLYRESGSPEQIATTSAYLGDVLTKQGRADEALKIYRAGLEKVEDLAV